MKIQFVGKSLWFMQNNNGVKQKFLDCFLKILDKKRKKWRELLPVQYLTKFEISCPDIIHKTKALQMYTFLNHRRWNRCSCIHKNDAELFFNVWHQLTKFSETGWPRSACNFIFPLRSRRNAIHRNSSRLSPSELVFSLGERHEEFRMMCIAH
jgi:hypothetical protein